MADPQDSRDTPDDSASRFDGLVGLIENSGAALTVALAIFFTFVIALVAIPLTSAPHRVTVATAAFTGIGTIAGAYFGVRVGAHGKEGPKGTGRRRSSSSSAWRTRSARGRPRKRARKFVRSRRLSRLRAEALTSSVRGWRSPVRRVPAGLRRSARATGCPEGFSGFRFEFTTLCALGGEFFGHGHAPRC